MKQSSIEWLHAEFSDLISKHLNAGISARDLITMHHNLYYEAKEKHKQEIENVYWDCLGDSITSEKFEIYYNKTFNT